jgi:regulator of sirC expression with transglutaminase-like and TPR domain
VTHTSSQLAPLLVDPATPIERVAFAIAEDFYPSASYASLCKSLDEFAEPLRAHVSRLSDRRHRALALTSHVYGALGFRGDEEHYYDPQNSFIQRVVERRKGIPITLAIVLMAVGRRVGIEVDGVGFPGHFLARIGGEDGYLVDPFARGQMLDVPALERLARRSLGPSATVTAQQLAVVDARAIATRMLTNLDVIYSSRGEHAHAMIVCDRLFALDGRPERVRDRGLHALALRANESAISDLERYLELAPEASDAARIRAAIGNLQSERSTLN